MMKVMMKVMMKMMMMVMMEVLTHLGAGFLSTFSSFFIHQSQFLFFQAEMIEEPENFDQHVCEGDKSLEDVKKIRLRLNMAVS